MYFVHSITVNSKFAILSVSKGLRLLDTKSTRITNTEFDYYSNGVVRAVFIFGNTCYEYMYQQKSWSI